MGIQQSREDSEPILKILRSISKHTYAQAKTKLENFSRNKCKMCVTKWELLLILQLSANDIKQISYFISGEQDTTEIDINLLLFLMVATQQEMELAEQLNEIIRFIIYDTGISEEDGKKIPAFINLDEFRYIFQIAYHFLQRISDLDLIQYPQIHDEQDKQYFGSEIEQKLIQECGLFRPDGCMVNQAVQNIQKSEEIKQYFQILKYGTNQDINEIQAEEAESPTEKPIEEDNDPTSKQKTDAKGTARKSKSKTSKEKQKSINIPKSNESSNTDIKIGATDQASKVIISSGQNSGRNKVIIDKNNSGGQHKTSQITGESTVFSNMSGSSVIDGQPGTAEVQEPFVEKKSPHSLELMSKHLMEMRNQNYEDIQLNDQRQTMDRVQENLSLMQHKNLEYYSSRQILQFMRTHNSFKASQELHHDQGSRILQQLMNEVSSIKGPEQAILQAKKQLRNTLDEYLQQSYTQLKYENALSKAQLVHFYAEGSQRGIKRTLEKKKFKLLGQIQTMRSIYSSFVESNHSMDIFQNDNLTSQIFKRIQDLYNSNLTQKFLLDFIALKNQKRDTKRFVDFMSGAKTQIDSICSNEFLNYRSSIVGIPSVYSDAKHMIDSKYHHLSKVTLEQVMQKYQFNKIQICNYNINLGKLKAYHLMIRLMEKSPDRILGEITDKIEKLRVKLEQVDIDIIKLIQNQQIKKKILKQQFSSIGALAVIKCGRKGLDFNRIYDYFSLAIIKQRTYESLWLIIDIKNSQQKAKEDPSNSASQILKPNGEQLGSLIKLQKIKYIAQVFELKDVAGEASQESLLQESYEEFQTFVDQQKQMCLKQSQNLGQTNNLDLKQAKKAELLTNADHINANARNNLKGIYQMIGCQEQLKQLNTFAGSKEMKKQVLQLDFSHMKAGRETTKIQGTYKTMLKEFDALDNFIFDYVPFTNDQEKYQESPCEPEEKDKEILAHIKALSTSLINISFDEQRKQMYREKKTAYKSVETFLASLLQSDAKTYEQDFKKQSGPLLKDAIEVLFFLNKKGFLNGFNMKFMSISIEHSMLNNYWSYQIIKCFLKEQMKAKIVADVSLIAYSNDIISPVLTQSAMNMQDINLSAGTGNDIINITHRQNAQGQQSGSVKAHSSGKIDKIYGSLFQILNNVDNFDRRGKQSFFKGLIQQLDSQMNVHEKQTQIYQEVMNDFTAHDKDMFRIQQTIGEMIEANTNSEALEGMFEQYEKANANYCWAQNQKHIDNIFQGALKYLSSLREVLNKESYDEGNVKGGGKSITEFINKLQSDISLVNSKLNAKFKRAQDEIQKQRDEAAALEKKKSKSSPEKSRTTSPTRVPTSPAGRAAAPKGDPIENEVKASERKIIEQAISVSTYQEIVIAIRKYEDPDVFANQIRERMTNVTNIKKDRLKIMRNYLETVTYLNDRYNNAASNLETQIAQENMSHGAKLMNAVLSGNIYNQIDIYANSKEKEDKGMTVTQATQQSQMEDQTPAPQDVQEDSTADLNRQLEATEGEDSPLSKATLATSAAKKEQQLKDQLSQNQRGLNYFINFLNQICQQEDRLSSRRILQQSYLFQFSNLSWIQYEGKQMGMVQLRNIEHALSNLVNIYEIQSTPIEKYLQTYELQSEYVKKNLFQMLTDSNHQLLEAEFLMIIQKSSQRQNKEIINKMDDVFHEATLEDDEKQEFSNATTKTRRNLDQELRSFREYLDSEANKKLDQVHRGALQQKENRLSQAISALGLLVRIYYLKQIQQQEDFQFCLQLKQHDS